MLSESDWKKFKKIKEKALDKICGKVLNDLLEGINDKVISNHGKYLYVFKIVENYDKRIAMMFDGHSRSKALTQLILMQQEDLLEEADIQLLSQEIQNVLKRHK